jgi:hypothetical protein
MTRSTVGSRSRLILKLGRKSTLLVTVAVLLLAASSRIQAQTYPASVDGAMPPTREGNIYDHKDHQPTEAEISRAQAAAGDRRNQSTSRASRIAPRTY